MIDVKKLTIEVDSLLGYLSSRDLTNNEIGLLISNVAAYLDFRTTKKTLENDNKN